MTDINEVMERLDTAARSGLLVSWHERDLKALLSYTKQCREALAEARKWVAGQPDRSTSIYDTNFAMLDAIDQALSTQPGERE